MNAALNALFDEFLAPFSGAHAALAMAAVSLATALAMLAVFRWTSNQPALRRAKARALACVLAIRLFTDDPWTTLRCLAGVLRANLAYVGHTLAPLSVLLVPLALIAVELDLRFGRRPLEPGEAATVRAVAGSGDYAELARASLRAPEGLAVETPALRIRPLGEVDWRIRAQRDGVYDLLLEVGGRTITKEVVVGDARAMDLRRLPGVRCGGGWLDRCLHPGEPPLPADGGVRALALDYPAREFRIFGFRVHWLLAFVLLSLGFAFILKKPLGVEV